MGVGNKLTLMGAGAVMLATVLMAGVAITQSRHMLGEATNTITASTEDALKSRATDALRMVKSLDQSDASRTSRTHELRRAIMKAAVGKTGYLWVLGGEGEKKGHYIISKDGQRDGEDIWASKDANGRPFIQEMINGARALPEGQCLVYRYDWTNPGEKAPRQKIAAVAYYKPWGWVIGAACYEDELYGIAALKEDQQRETLWLMVAALVAMAVGALGIRMYAQRMSAQLNRLTAAADALSLGDVEKANGVLTDRAA